LPAYLQTATQNLSLTIHQIVLMRKTFPYRFRVIILLFFLILITYLDRVTISLVGVRIKAALKLSNEQFGWVLGAFALAYALFEIPNGILGDRIGQRKVFIRVVLWWSLFTALTGFVTGLTTLMITRFLFGMGEAGAFPTGSATISRWLPAAETARGTSWLITGTAAGAAIAPLIVVPLASAYGWRMPFFVNGLVGVGWVLVCFVWFKDDPTQMKNIPAEEKEIIVRNRRFISKRGPFLWRPALRNKSLLALVTAFFCSQWALYFFVAWMPIYLQEGRHFSENQMKLTSSWLFATGIIAGFAGGIFIDWLVIKKGLRYSRVIIGVVACTMMSLLFFIVARTENNTVATISLISCYSFVPIIGINAFSTCIDMGKNKAGTVVGIMSFVGNMGAFFLSVLFGKIADVTKSFNIPMYLLSAILLLGGCMWLLVDASKQIESVDEVIEAKFTPV
jgi:MFS transporter, ACS family, glucarate transporter